MSENGARFSILIGKKLPSLHFGRRIVFLPKIGVSNATLFWKMMRKEMNISHGIGTKSIIHDSFVVSIDLYLNTFPH